MLYIHRIDRFRILVAVRKEAVSFAELIIQFVFDNKFNYNKNNPNKTIYFYISNIYKFILCL